MDKARENHIKEIQRLEDAIKRTRSERLKTDYGKALRRMYGELKIYDSLKRGCYGKRTKSDSTGT